MRKIVSQVSDDTEDDDEEHSSVAPAWLLLARRAISLIDCRDKRGWKGLEISQSRSMWGPVPRGICCPFKVGRGADWGFEIR